MEVTMEVTIEEKEEFIKKNRIIKDDDGYDILECTADNCLECLIYNSNIDAECWDLYHKWKDDVRREKLNRILEDEHGKK